MAETHLNDKLWKRIFSFLPTADLARFRGVNRRWKEIIDDERLWVTPTITCTAPVNIAVIKYWGKRDTEKILPTNSSLSGTLHQEDLRSLTSVYASRRLSQDEFYLNGEKCDINATRTQNCLRLVRASAGTLDKDGSHVPPEAWKYFKIRIDSSNNFPTAAGLASSASGFCCLTYTLSRLYALPDDRHSLSMIARQGSGSACRSMFGGFSGWNRGEKDDGSDSFAFPVVPETHWPSMRILVLVANDQKKDVGSTEGMQFSLQGKAGEHLQRRGNVTVPRRMTKIEEAIRKKDFDRFAQITMKDSDDFHYVCRITEPRLSYMNATSDMIVKVVNAFNDASPDGKRRAAYTFDAGPNGVIYIEEEHTQDFLRCVLHCFPPPDGDEKDFYTSRCKLEFGLPAKLPASLPPPAAAALDMVKQEVEEGSISLKYLLSTRLGPGPQILSQ
mmetsp:Transcript_15466/g.43836  ORF Transcript_15466/g.43836 Transcript_15466/m.43836 type:complete len:444 (-) Transcript_15466:181-1512(-)